MPEISRIPAETEMNDHHGVPRSFLGSNDKLTNITQVLVREHNAFHDMAGHRPPASFLRRALLSSINWHDNTGKMLPAGLYRDMLPALTPGDWRALYQSGALRDEIEHGSGKSRTKAAVHLHIHLWEEQQLVAEAIAALGISRYLSRDVRNFTNGAMLFFHTDQPTEVMKSYLIDKNHLGERKWTKPLRHDVHSHLCDLVKHVKLERMTLESRKNLLRVLNNHHEELQDRADSWHPALDKSIDGIAEYGQMHMEKMFLKVRG